MTLAELVRRPVDDAARALIGWTFLVDGIGGRIVEVEAYSQNEPASHSYRGPTRRNATMFGPPGRLYVYRSYGVHWCANIVCGSEGRAEGVLLRAIQPLQGLAPMQARRGIDDARRLCAGPGRLCEALAITGADDGARVGAGRFSVEPPAVQPDVVATRRIGISKAVELPWRFVEAGTSWASRAQLRA